MRSESRADKSTNSACTGRKGSKCGVCELHSDKSPSSYGLFAFIIAVAGVGIVVAHCSTDCPAVATVGREPQAQAACPGK